MLQLVREVPIRIIVQTASLARRGFLFYCSVGVSKAVDSMTGMTVNLLDLDQWLHHVQGKLEKTVWVSNSETVVPALKQALVSARQQLVLEAAKQDALIASLEFREERLWSFGLNLKNEWTYKSTHFLEAFLTSEQDFDILKIEFHWKRGPDCETDLQHEAFKILKGLHPKGKMDLYKQLQGHLGFLLESGSELKGLDVHHLGEAFSLSL